MCESWLWLFSLINLRLFLSLSQKFWTGLISDPRSVMMDAAASCHSFPSKPEVGLTSHTARQHGERQVSCWCGILWASGRKKRQHGGGVRFQNPENKLDLCSCFHQLISGDVKNCRIIWHFADLDSVFSGWWRFGSSTGSVQLYLKIILMPKDNELEFRFKSSSCFSFLLDR